MPRAEGPVPQAECRVLTLDTCAPGAAASDRLTARGVRGVRRLAHSATCVALATVRRIALPARGLRDPARRVTEGVHSLHGIVPREEC